MKMYCSIAVEILKYTTRLHVGFRRKSVVDLNHCATFTRVTWSLTYTVYEKHIEDFENYFCYKALLQCLDFLANAFLFKPISTPSFLWQCTFQRFPSESTTVPSAHNIVLFLWIHYDSFSLLFSTFCASQIHSNNLQNISITYISLHIVNINVYQILNLNNKTVSYHSLYGYQHVSSWRCPS